MPLAWLTVPALMGPVIGPPLGGFISTVFSWRWIFWINLPIGLLGLALAGLGRHARAPSPGALANGYVLFGSPAIAVRGDEVITAQAVVLPASEAGRSA